MEMDLAPFFEFVTSMPFCSLLSLGLAASGQYLYGFSIVKVGKNWGRLSPWTSNSQIG